MSLWSGDCGSFEAFSESREKSDIFFNLVFYLLIATQEKIGSNPLPIEVHFEMYYPDSLHFHKIYFNFNYIQICKTVFNLNFFLMM